MDIMLDPDHIGMKFNEPTPDKSPAFEFKA